MSALKHFKPDEFVMGYTVVYDKMNADFLQKLDDLRDDVDPIQFHITSSYRTPEHNKKIGGYPKSMHLQGRAVDIVCTNGVDRRNIVWAAIEMGLTVGVGDDFLHIDDRDNPIIFGYG